MILIIDKLTIRARLVAGFGVLLAVLLVLTVIAILSLDRVVTRTGKADDANRLVKYVLDIRGEEKNYLLRGSAKEAQNVQKLIMEVENEIEKIRIGFDTAGNHELLDAFVHELGEYTRVFQQYLQLDQDSNSQKLAMEAAARSLEGVLDEFRDLQKQQLGALLARGVQATDIQEELDEADAANRLIKYLLEARTEEKNFQLRGDSKAIEQVTASLTEALGLADELAAGAERETSKQVALSVRADLLDYRRAFEKFVADRVEQSKLQALLVVAARALEEQAQALRADQKGELLADIDGAEMLIELVAAGAVILAALVAWLMVRTVVVPLNEVTFAMQDVAEGEGDLTRRLPAQGDHEIAQLAKAFNAFSEKMRTAIETVAENVEQLSSASEELSATALQSNAASATRPSRWQRP
ncbi:hypothetical protein A8B84_16805 [Marinobacter sp. EhC06]|uniref:HAMP domain-containing protein n=1 Tax=Marinobacter TaxID=2742 RepID=UPI0007DA3348|nr:MULTISPECIES: methyl-accepting chemotaxis protein [unclassified Marinobacter]OAN92773.1 hypothetical protein A8B80_17975 [Marinobacter sp. EhN04]OAN96298.1 hypothetical protein A8B84_16805 [Marinobacter sp. EhC06]